MKVLLISANTESINMPVIPVEAMKVSVGIRIYPGTALAQRAVDEGVVSPDDDLLFPRFYLATECEGWLQDTVRDWMAERPNWMR